jgi:uncharacterized protein YecT (DUF1311 family)
MNGLLRSLLALTLLSAGVVIQAQTKAAAQIEADLKKALETPQGQTTQGMVDANDQAVQAYAREIQRVYGTLRKGLSKPQKQALEQSQAAWLKYLASQRQVASYIYDAPGTIHRVMGSAALKQVLKHRLEELCEWFLGGEGDDPFSEAVPGREFWCGDTHARLMAADPLADLAGEKTPPKAKQNP